MSVTRLHADRGELSRFVNAVFCYADSSTYASLRAFDQFQKGVAAEFIRPIEINGSLEPLIDAAEKAAGDAANNPKAIVFAPPICTFSNPDRARLQDLANGLTLSVEIDDGDIKAARIKLESILGPATAVCTLRLRLDRPAYWRNPAEDARPLAPIRTNPRAGRPRQAAPSPRMGDHARWRRSNRQTRRPSVALARQLEQQEHTRSPCHH